MNYISDILYWISTGLLVPVIVLLIILFVRSLLLIGSFFGQYLSIRKTDALLRKAIDELTPDCIQHLEKQFPEQSNAPIIRYMRQMLETRNSPAHVQRLLADYEIKADKDLALSKTLTKMGPMLGLMGTLIPMGPALVGLSTGRFCHNGCRSVCSSRRFHYPTGQTALVSAGYDQPGIPFQPVQRKA